jgi:tight adherence protein C
MTIYLAPLLIALSVFVAIMGFRALMPRRQRVSERLEKIRTSEGAAVESGPSIVDEPLPPFWRAVSVVGWVLPNLAQSENLQWDLAQAGYRRPGVTGLFVAFKVMLAVLLWGASFIVGLHYHVKQDQLIIMSIACAAIGFYIPNIWLARMSSKRQEEIRLALPDALDLMVICVEAGQGLNAALVTVSREMLAHAPRLSEEMRLISSEIRAGLARAAALRNFASRAGVEEARALCAVLIQSDRLGTSIAQALRVHAQSMRTRRRQRAEENARKTAVKLLFPLVFCIFPALLVVILAPAVIQIVRTLSDTATPGQ